VKGRKDRNDAQALLAGEPEEVRKNVLAIAGADKDVFAPVPGCEAPEITVERNSQFASYIDLPIIPG
jgi:hypothetical protein